MADIEKMTLLELRDHRKAVDALIAQKEVEDRQKAMEAAKEAARQFGFDIGDLFGASRPSSSSASDDKKPKKTADAKFVNPSDPSKTWSGKGRKPDWLKAGLALGRTEEDFLIK